MSVATQVAQASPLAPIFERYHVGWETRKPDMITSLHSEDTIFWLHDGSDPVKGRDALLGRIPLGSGPFLSRWRLGLLGRLRT